MKEGRRFTTFDAMQMQCDSKFFFYILITTFHTVDLSNLGQTYGAMLSSLHFQKPSYFGLFF